MLKTRFDVTVWTLLTVGNSECSSDHSLTLPITRTCSAALQSGLTGCAWSALYLGFSLPLLWARLFFYGLMTCCRPCLFLITTPRRLPCNQTLTSSCISAPQSFCLPVAVQCSATSALLSELLFVNITCLLFPCGILTQHFACEFPQGLKESKSAPLLTVTIWRMSWIVWRTLLYFPALCLLTCGWRSLFVGSLSWPLLSILSFMLSSHTETFSDIIRISQTML